ncbi:MAG TPA: hypothetical protein VIJ56_01890 [Acidimicrobiales bacterium]
MQPRATVPFLVASGLLAALVLSACSNNGSPSPATTTTTSSSSSDLACTKSLITAAAESSSSVGSVSAVNGFGCSGSWAYADVTVGSGAASFDAVIVLQSQGSSWSVADRANACNNHLVPSAIYTQACTTS